MSDNKIKTEKTVEVTEVDELQNQLDKAHRTDHLTLPVVVPTTDVERQKASDLERQAILNPDKGDDTVMWADGTTRKELRDRLLYGIMPKDAPKEAKEGVGKHQVKMSTKDGEPVVIITPPEGNKVVITEPKVVPEDAKTPAGMESMHSTSPVPEGNQKLEQEASKNGDKNKK